MKKADEHLYYIGVGSNVLKEDALQTLLAQLAQTELPGLLCSPAYASEGIGAGVGQTYSNAVACYKSDLSATDLQKQLKSIEEKQGRRKGSKEVYLDLDLVEQDGCILRPKDAQQTYYQIGRQWFEKNDDTPKDVYQKPDA